MSLGGAGVPCWPHPLLGSGGWDMGHGRARDVTRDHSAADTQAQGCWHGTRHARAGTGSLLSNNEISSSKAPTR